MRISDWSSDVCSSDRREKLAHLRREATGEALRKTIDSEPVEQPAFAIGVAQRRWCSLVQYGKIIPHQNLARQRLVALAILRLKDMAFDLQDQFERLRIDHSFDPLSREIGRAHVRTPVTHAPPECHLL